MWRTPGHPDDAVTVFLGYGRSKSGRVGTDVGFNGYALRCSDAHVLTPAARLRRSATATDSRIRRAGSTSTSRGFRARKT